MSGHENIVLWQPEHTLTGVGHVRVGKRGWQELERESFTALPRAGYCRDETNSDMAEKSIKDWKSLSVFPGIVRRSDKGCLKKIIFPLVITTLKCFRSTLFQRGKLLQGLSPWPAELFLWWGFWHGGAVLSQTILCASS